MTNRHQGDDPSQHDEARIDDYSIMASTPDPDAPPCEECGGGLAHYPECSATWFDRRFRSDDRDEDDDRRDVLDLAMERDPDLAFTQDDLAE